MLRSPRARQGWTQHGFSRAGAAMLTLLAASGCDSGSNRSSEVRPEPAVSGKEAQALGPVRTPGAGQTTATARAKKPGKGKHAIEWHGPVKWLSWEDGLAEAKRSGKGICVLVYADWCSKCRALTPVFRRPDIVKLSEKLVMVIQDQDEKPDWLARVMGSPAGYVPRILFLDSQGKLRPEINSGHPRYPYFYSASQVQTLSKSLGSAATPAG